LSIHFKKHEIVAPGDLLAEGDFKSGEGTYKENNKIFSSLLGLAEQKGKLIYVVPLESPYIPKIGDIVIGKVLSSSVNGSSIDLGSLYNAALFPEYSGKFREYDESEIYKVGDIIIAKIISFNRTRDPYLTTGERGLGKLIGGSLIRINPAKVPRLIGKKGSMIKMLKEETNARIKIGQNGFIWFSVRDERMEDILIEAIKKIEREAHTSGLTDRVKELIRRLKEEKLK